MPGRILVVDDVLANVRLLEARLGAEYFDVCSATSGVDALKVVAQWPCDIVLLDVMMPGMDGFEVCRRIKADPRSAHVPVIMITALDRADDRIKGLQAGADEFLTKPVNDVALIARVKNLVSVKRVTDELRLRAQTGSQFGIPDHVEPALGAFGRVLVVDDRPSSSSRLLDILREDCLVDIESDPPEALIRAAENGYETIIINLALASHDPLRLVSQLRALERTRLVPIVLISDENDHQRVVRALELGVNDNVVRPVEGTELLLRVRAQIARKRATDRIATEVEETIAMAITDPLTGLRNRHYLESHLDRLVGQSLEANLDLSVLVIDIDHFKKVNDIHGHDAGDAVLKAVAARLRHNTRELDLACRLGGEEFVLLMPETDVSLASTVAERLRKLIEATPFDLPDGETLLPVTVSIGVAGFLGDGDSGAALIKRADTALYRAKADGRNAVVCSDAPPSGRSSGPKTRGGGKPQTNARRTRAR